MTHFFWAQVMFNDGFDGMVATSGETEADPAGRKWLKGYDGLFLVTNFGGEICV